MATKILLTTEQHDKLINHIVSEVVTNSNQLINEDGTINEGVWEKVKYGLSKLGRYKANGKIFGKGKIDQEAGAKIQAIIDKQGNELIKTLNANIKSSNPEFPNNEKGNDFLNTVMEISGVYDSIISAVKQGILPVDAANGIINDLRDYVKKFLDVDLTAAYSVVDEIEGNTLELTEEDAMSLDEAWGIDEEDGPNGIRKKPNPEDIYAKGEPEDISKPIDLFPNDTRPVKANSQVATTGNKDVTTTGNNSLATTGNKGLAKTSNINISGQGKSNPRQQQEPEDIAYQDIAYQDIHNAKDVRSKLQAKRGGGEDFASTRMDTLKSNKLAMALAGAGASLGAFSWLANTDWFKHLFDVVSKNPSIEMIKQTVGNNTEIIGNIKPGQGLTQLMNSMNHAGITPNTTPEQFLEQVKILGGGDVNAGINALAAKGGIFVNPEAAKSVLTDIAQNPHGHGNTLGQIFKGKWAGTGKSVGDMLTCRDMGQVKGLIAGTITKAIPTIVAKTAIKTGAGYAAAKGLGAILGPIGIAAVGTGALIKLMRMKGQKQSRAKTLNDLYQSLRNIDGGTGLIKIETEPVTIDQASDIKQLGQGQPQLPNGEEPKQLGQGQPQLPNGEEPKQLGQGQPQLPNGEEPTEKPNKEVKSDSDTAFKGLTNLFKYITSTKKDVEGKFKKAGNDLGNKAIWKKNNSIVNIKKMSPNTYQIKLNNGKNIEVPAKDLKPLTNTYGSESKYFKNENLNDYLTKTIGEKKLKEFEGFLSNLNQVRDSVKGLGPTGSKKTDILINKMKKNPIMYTDFEKLFDVNDRQNFDNVKNEIKALANEVYSNASNLRSSMDELLRSNSNNLQEAVFNPEEEGQNRKKFKKYLIQFLSDAIKLFKNLIANKTKQPVKKAAKPKQPEQGSLFESVEITQKNKVINEHVERIKKIMYNSN